MVNKNNNELKSLINNAYKDTIELSLRNKKNTEREKFNNHSFTYNATKVEKVKSDSNSIDKGTILYRPKTEKKVSTLLLKSNFL